MFELVKVPTYNLGKVNDGSYSFISCTSVNNGVAKYCDVYSYDASDEPIITVSETGSQAGYCFVQYGKFAVHEHVSILKLKPEYAYLIPYINQLAILMTAYFTHKYDNYDKKLNNSALLYEVLPNIPFIRDENGDAKIDVSCLLYAML